ADQPAVVGVPFLVGRDEELGLLRRRWEQAKERLGQVVLLSGTAGIGKSALTEVLRAQVRDEGLPRIAFRCSAYHQTSARYPVIPHVERVLDVQREDPPATRLDKLEQGLRPYRPAARRGGAAVRGPALGAAGRALCCPDAVPPAAEAADARCPGGLDVGRSRTPTGVGGVGRPALG